MNASERFASAFRLFDAANQRDPNTEEFEGKTYPKELLYAMRMTVMLDYFAPDASEALMLTARCQHICRWEIPRESYGGDRAGYLKWRRDLSKFHADKASEILRKVGYSEKLIERVAFLLRKKRLKKDPETQTLEDVICLVFLRYYLKPFMDKHPENKIIDILQKTWKKMSVSGQATAKNLPYPETVRNILQKALPISENF